MAVRILFLSPANLPKAALSGFNLEHSILTGGCEQGANNITF